MLFLHDSSFYVNRTARLDKPLVGYYMLKLEPPNDI